MSLQDPTSTFYADLPAFDVFLEVADLTLYRPLPDDWTLLVSDVVDSTGAIERGEYKTVNMVGAASITAIINVAPGATLPFVFGGDGGMIAVPPEILPAACTEMKRLQAASKGLFGLSLRAAAIPVSALRAAGADTLVKKYRLSQGNYLAMFAGAGAATADKWLKSDDTSNGYALLPDPDEDLPNLNGLSCRWQPLKARNGTMLTIILLPLVDDGCAITTASDAISDILGGEVPDFAPVHETTLKFRFPPAGLALEIAAGASRASWIKRSLWACFTATMQYLCERLVIKIGGYDGATYRAEMKTNTDYRKFDGALRMVLDVTTDQAARIESFLDREFTARRLVYGTWTADHALMTCLLFNLAENRHVHFVDGANGGYAMAARAMKNRMAALGGTPGGESLVV